MIERHIFVRLKPNDRTQAGVEVRTGATLLGRLPQIRGLRLLLPADAAAQGAWDLALVMEFASIEMAHDFEQSAAYQSFAEDVLEAHALVVKAWNLTPANAGTTEAE